jgi:hypothetical protein
MPKTGTTALQQFFYQNRGELQARGITYPELGLVGHCHHRIGASLYEPDKRPPFIRYPNTATLTEYADQLRESEDEVLLSTELMSWGFFAPLVKAAFRDIEIRPIVYLRRQDAYIESLYRQVVKGVEARDLEGYVKIYKWLDYREHILSGWIEQFGKGNMLVRPYERTQFAGGSIYSDFLRSVFGWGLTDAFKLPDGDLNPRLKNSAIAFKLAVNRLDLTDEEKCRVGSLMEQTSCLKNSSQDSSTTNDSLMSPNLRRLILNQCAESNAWIARNMLGRRETPLFAEEVEKEGPPPDKMLLTPDTIRSMMAMLRDMDLEIWRKIVQTIELELRESTGERRQDLEFFRNNFDAC